MKNSKFWIWFIPLLIIVCVGIYTMLVKNNKPINENTKTDAVKIKEEYAKYNDEYFEVSLSDNNVYKLINDDEIKNIFDGKDGLIYFGEYKNNISRKNIIVLNDVISSTSIPEVYYYDLNNINDEFKNYLIKKLEINEIIPGTLLSIQGGNVLDSFYPNYVLDNKELTTEEKEMLLDEYKLISDIFVEACNEDC